MVRPAGESSYQPAPIDTENLLKTLEEWNHHLEVHASLSQTPLHERYEGPTSGSAALRGVPGGCKTRPNTA
ncbi:protein of unknown function [Nitrospira japonica]|uniref:Uncharacterized protein n=1 Tax=Nitrospira japonica TaxID=1325564 RepID=A0A1W1I326_9BACT|nr:protein of unknown function [Nitrospira japonica]